MKRRFNKYCQELETEHMSRGGDDYDDTDFFKRNNILNVIDNEDYVALEIRCPTCQRRVITFSDTDTFCDGCGDEIEEKIVAAWEEYSKMRSTPISKEKG